MLGGRLIHRQIICIRHVKRCFSACRGAGVVLDSSGYFWAKQQQIGGVASSTLLLGVTTTFLEEKVPGDVERVFLSKTGSSNTSTSLTLNFEWSGLKIGEGDELYHSVWSNEEGTASIDLVNISIIPKVNMELVQINDLLLKDPSSLDDDCHILEIGLSS
jgi:hypothetical protein